LSGSISVDHRFDTVGKSSSPRQEDAPEITAAPNLLKWVGMGVVGLGLIWVAYQLVVNPGFQWSIVGAYMFHPDILRGVLLTIELTFWVMSLATFLGIVIAVMHLSGSNTLKFCAHAYLWFFRGVPSLVQLTFWYNLAILFPEITLGVPFGGPKFFSISATEAITAFTASLLALGLIEGAYMAEVIRAGLLSVDKGQTEASKALGHRPVQTFFVVILPQAMRAIVPPTGNQVIGTLKYTSLASIVTLSELMHSVELIYTRTFQTIPLLIVAALWYLILVSILSVVQLFIERHYSKGWERHG